MQIKLLLSNIIENSFKNIDIVPKITVVTDATKPEFGDFQYNGAMALAKELKSNPRDIAQKLAAELEKSAFLSKVEVAGPGFINLTIDKGFIEKNIENVLNDRGGVELKDESSRIVVDYSSPNMAKQMHVGHLRSTVIGDSIANLFEFMGDDVVRQNHIGDWGTQFGMLIAFFEESKEDSGANLSDLESFYRAAKKRFDESEEFANRSRDYVVKLQGGDESCLALWREFIDTTLNHTQEVYDSLGVKLDSSSVRGESAYNSDLVNIIEQLKSSELLEVSQGANCVFIEGNENPLIVQKSDGGYLYATTDLAAISYRVQELGAARVSYVVDARQGEHFKQVFKVAKLAGFANEDTLLEHIAFGMVLDKSGKPFKTRSGDTVKLQDLIDESIKRAKDVIKNASEYSEDELDNIAKIIGVGALKYADLSINRTSNYIFDWDKMLSLDGNTSLYLQYAYARIQSILRRAEGFNSSRVELSDELERKMALKLLSFEDMLQKAYTDAMPHLITTYLYELTTLFMRFYENNPILRDDIENSVRDSRLTLAKATANIIKRGLDILGIKVLDRL